MLMNLKRAHYALANAGAKLEESCGTKGSQKGPHFYVDHPQLLLTKVGQAACHARSEIRCLNLKRANDQFYIEAAFKADPSTWHVACEPGSFLSAVRTWLHLVGTVRGYEWNSNAVNELLLLVRTAAASVGLSDQVAECQAVVLKNF